MKPRTIRKILVVSLSAVAVAVALGGAVVAADATAPDRILFTNVHIFDGKSEELAEGHCQSKILNTWSSHRTAQIDPDKCRKIDDPEIRF